MFTKANRLCQSLLQQTPGRKELVNTPERRPRHLDCTLPVQSPDVRVLPRHLGYLLANEIRSDDLLATFHQPRRGSPVPTCAHDADCRACVYHQHGSAPPFRGQEPLHVHYDAVRTGVPILADRLRELVAGR